MIHIQVVPLARRGQVVHLSFRLRGEIFLGGVICEHETNSRAQDPNLEGNWA